MLIGGEVLIKDFSFGKYFVLFCFVVLYMFNILNYKSTHIFCLHFSLSRQAFNKKM